MAKSKSTFRLPVLRRGAQPLGRALRGLRRVEHHRRGDRRFGRRRRPEIGHGRRPADRTGAAVGRDRERGARRHRHRRTRPGHRRRLRHGLGACWSAAIRASASRRCCCRRPRRWPIAASASSTSRAKRRWRRSGCGRSGSGSATAECCWRPRPMSRSSSRRCRTGPAPDLVIIDSIQTLWTDRVDSAPGTVTQVRTSAQALTRFAKKIRRRGGAGRPRHQGRPDRRAARRRAHGRCGALFRGRRQPHLPHPARRQEPLRRDRRDRRLRDDRRWACARSPTRRRCSSTSATRTPPARRCSPAWRARGRC